MIFARIKYYLDCHIKEGEVGRASGTYGRERERSYMMFVGKIEERGFLGKNKSRFWDNIKMYFK